MGPEATAVFYHYLIKITPAGNDQEHIPVIIYSQPRIPDRTEFLVAGGESPLPLLLETARVLETAGADLIAIPCNTAHIFWKEIQESLSIPVLHIIRESAEKVRQDYGTGTRIGILSTTGTIRTALYQKELEKVGLVPVPPTQEEQSKIHGIITQIKAGNTGDETREALLDIIQGLKEGGSSAVILGCTELGIVVQSGPREPGIYDSLLILAEKSVELALKA